MYKKEYENFMDVSDFEPSSGSQVSIKLKLSEEPNVNYTEVIFENNKKTINNIKYNDLKTSKNKSPINKCTITCHQSSVCKLSSRCHSSSQQFYELFMGIIKDNKDIIAFHNNVPSKN